MRIMFRDLAYAVRVLLKNPGFTAVAILTLAVGIGANSAIFSLVDAMVLHPLSYRDPDRLVTLSEVQQRGRDLGGTSPLNFGDWEKQAQLLERVAAYKSASFNLTGEDEPERVRGCYVSASLFPMLGIEPAAGRAFLPEEAQAGRDRVVVISEGLWKRRFGGAPGLIGNTITVEGESLTVVGVMPAAFQFPPRADKSELWAPLVFGEEDLRERAARNVSVIARLKPGVSLKQSQAEMDTIAGRLEREYPKANEGWGVSVISLSEQVVGPARLGMLSLLGAVAFVLLIACANVANLLLARATARQKEIAVRAALGASRLRLIRQLLTESILLSALSGACGLLLAYWGIQLLVTSFPDWLANALPRIREIGLDWRMLGFTLMISILTGALFGLVPALQAKKADLNSVLKDSVRGSSGGRGRRLANLLIVSEVALALALLVGAGLMIKSFLYLQQVEPGFDARNVLTLQTSLSRAKYEEPAQVSNFYAQALKSIETVPGVQSAGAISHLPMGLHGIGTEFTIVGQPAPDGGKPFGAGYRVVSPNYFRTMGIALTKGRDFSERDVADSPPVAVVNETLARRFWPDTDPVGQRIIISRGQTPGREAVSSEIVGVAGDVRHFGPHAKVISEIYVSHLQQSWRDMTVVVKTSSPDSRQSAAGVQREIRNVGRDQPVYNVRTMDEVMSESTYPQRLAMTLLGIFAVIALLLATVGIYAVVSYSVSQRTHEIGIRMALGAQRVDVLKLVIKQGMMLVLGGVVVGVLIAVVTMRVISSLLYGVNPADPTSLIGVSLLLIVVAVVACYLPARRATKVDPLEALRFE